MPPHRVGVEGPLGVSGAVEPQGLKVFRWIARLG